MKTLKEIANSIIKENRDKYYIADGGSYSMSYGTNKRTKRYTVWQYDTNQPIEASNDVGYLMNKYHTEKVHSLKNAA